MVPGRIVAMLAGLLASAACAGFEGGHRQPIKSPHEIQQEQMRQQWQQQQDAKRRQEEEAQRREKEAYLVLRIEEGDAVTYKVIASTKDHKGEKRKGYKETVEKKFPRTEKGKEQADKVAADRNEQEAKRQKRREDRK